VPTLWLVGSDSGVATDVPDPASQLSADPETAATRGGARAHVFVDPPVAFDIEAWSDYGLGVVGGAAALTGLLVVAVSVSSAWFSSSKAHRGRSGQALLLFAPLVTGILLLILGQSTTTLGIEIAVVGLLVGRVIFKLHTGDLKDEPRVLVLLDRLSPRGAITAALIACGASLIAGRFGGLYWLAGAHVGALLAGLVNAWVFLLLAGAPQEE